MTERAFETIDAALELHHMLSSAAPIGRLRWLHPEELPALAVGGQQLGAAVRLLGALQRGDPRLPQVAALLRAHVDPHTLRAWLLRLLAQWEGSRTPGQWVFGALGLLGDGALAAELAKKLYVWRGSSKYAWVRMGMGAIAAIGSDAALRQLNLLAAQDEFRSLRSSAGEHMDRIAAARGVSRQQLEDMIVPRFGIDTGELQLALGARRFRLVLDPDLAPALVEQDGRHYRAMPRSAPGLPPEQIAAAQESWRTLRREVNHEIRTQSRRLESAMVEGRRWAAGDWRRIFLGHPLLEPLARQVLWAGYDEAGQPIEVFCLAGDGSLTSESYGPALLDAYAAVGIPHPVDATPARRRQWDELQHDFDILPLFPQAARTIYTIAAAQASETSIPGLPEGKLRAGVSISTASKGWRHSAYQTYDAFSQIVMTRSFASPGITAVVVCQICPEQHYESSQRCSEGYFVAGGVPDLESGELPRRIPMGQVPPALISEVLCDWHDLFRNPRHHYEG